MVVVLERVLLQLLVQFQVQVQAFMGRRFLLVGGGRIGVVLLRAFGRSGTDRIFCR